MDPRLFRDGTDRFDVNQGQAGQPGSGGYLLGQAGTCWFLAVLAAFAEYPHIIDQVR